MTKPLVVILMGSKADSAHCQKIAEAAQQLGLEVVQRIGSAHKSPAHVLRLLDEYESDARPKVYITVAGRSNALSGFVDGAVRAPVIACPPSPNPPLKGGGRGGWGWADLYSSLRMPTGIAPGVVLEPANAALLAAKILALTSSEVMEQVQIFQKQQTKKILDDDVDEKAA
jgi:5-(carboxyamino)imidazole ribonucleotide mutase